MSPRAAHTLAASTGMLTIGTLEVSPASGTATAGGRVVRLTAREFDVLLALAERADRVVPRHELYEAVWGRQPSHRDRSVDVHVRKLRQKLADAQPGWQHVHTHYGFGYRLSPEPAESGG